MSNNAVYKTHFSVNCQRIKQWQTDGTRRLGGSPWPQFGAHFNGINKRRHGNTTQPLNINLSPNYSLHSPEAVWIVISTVSIAKQRHPVIVSHTKRSVVRRQQVLQEFMMRSQPSRQWPTNFSLFWLSLQINQSKCSQTKFATGTFFIKWIQIQIIDICRVHCGWLKSGTAKGKSCSGNRRSHNLMTGINVAKGCLCIEPEINCRSIHIKWSLPRRTSFP